MTDKQPRNNNRSKTIPWMTEEFVVVAGLPLVYLRKGDSSEILVMMPGPYAMPETPAELRRRGLSVVMPRILRRPEPVTS